MKKLMETGPYLYAAALAGFGIIQLVTQNFLTGLLPVPESFPLRSLFVNLTSGIFLLTAGGIFFNVRQQLAAVAAGCLFLIFFFFLDIPGLITDIYNAGLWAGTFETVMLFSGAFIMAPFLTNERVEGPQWSRVINAMSVLCRYFFALSLFVFAIQHIKYEAYIETLIPAWLPAIAFWSYLVIAAYLLAGISFITRVRLFLASALLGSMFLVWVFILHAPRAIAKMTKEPEWSSLCVCLAVAGASFCIGFYTYRRPSTYYLRTP
jgi:hypothetical protein